MTKYSISTLILISFLLSSCEKPEVIELKPGHYLEAVYDEIEITKSVIYGNQPQTHWMDLYQAQNDSLPSRPLVILAPGGGFNPELIHDSYEWLKPLAEKLAHAGYLVALINYTTGETDSPEKYKRVFYSALYDLKAVIRFFRRDADHENFYRTDVDRIFTGGWSAGAQIGLFNAYANNPGELSSSQLHELMAYEGFDGNRGSPGYSSQVTGMIALAGNMAELNRMQNGDPVILCVHSTEDYTVRIDSQASAFGMAFGSRPIIDRAHDVGIINRLIEIEEGTHTTPIRQECPSCYDQVIRFIWENLGL